MAALVTLDRLPPHAIQSIIGYTIEAPSTCDNSALDFASHDQAKPLLHLCRSWRGITLPIVYSKCDANFSDTVCLKYSSTPSNAWFRQSLDTYYNAFVRSVSMSIDYKYIANGHVLQLLKCDNFIMRLENARSLNVVIAIDDADYANDTEEAENVQKFAGYLDKLLPFVSVVELEIIDRLSENKNISQTVIHPLINIFTHSKQLIRLIIDEVNSPAIIKCLHNIQIFTQIVCKWNSEHADLANLITANAQVLQSLLIYAYSFTGLEKLFCTSQGESIRYPSLICLDINNNTESSRAQIPICTNDVLFPQLVYASFHGSYLFSDDTPFRGNSQTLECLGMTLDSRVVSIVNKHNVFSTGKFKSLKQLQLFAEKSGIMPNITSAGYQKFFDSVLPSIRFLIIFGQELFSSFSRWLPKGAQFRRLHMLTLVHCDVQFIKLLKLVRMFPELKKVVFKLDSKENTFDDRYAAHTAISLGSQLSVVSSNLQILTMYEVSQLNASATAAIILLLVDRCPNLRLVKLPPEQKAIVLGIYNHLMNKAHLPHLKSVLQNSYSFILVQAGDAPFIQVKHK